MDEHKLRQIWENVATIKQLQGKHTKLTYENIEQTSSYTYNLPLLATSTQTAQKDASLNTDINSQEKTQVIALSGKTANNETLEDTQNSVNPGAETVAYATETKKQTSEHLENYLVRKTKAKSSIEIQDNVTLDSSDTVDFVPGTSKYVKEVRDKITTANYECIDKIGQGGMGVVFRGFQKNLQREIAIKKLRPEKTTKEKKFIGEALVTAYLEHPNIVPVHDLGRGSDGEIMLAMKMIGGTSWKELLHPQTDEERQKAQKYNLDAHLRILLVVCNAVAFAHSKGIVHNDLKPENVMIGEFGEVQLMDWGLAVDIEEQQEPRTLRKSEIVAPMGTPCYIAPELVGGEGNKIGPWTDVYLLGAVLYEIVSGKPPHTGDTMWEVLVSAYKGNLPKFSNTFPRELKNICKKSMAREPQKRYSSVKEFQNALNKYLQNRESLKFLFISSIYIALLLTLGTVVMYMFAVEEALNDKQKIRHLSYITAQELRQSSDDLTRMARSYVTTKNKKFKALYYKILDVRNGKTPRSDGRQISLRKIMEDLGFTDQEFAKLKESENYSNELVKTEIKAMQALENGQQQQAITMMFDNKYHQNKKTIMRPIDNFFILIDNRTKLSVDTYIWKSFIYLLVVAAIIVILIIISIASYISIYRTVKFRATLTSN
ncbi:serine/threonine-protein kinase [Candidatus Uabimicrobium sp. HlEnr_7]|uniref:serine/threonine-protein kinase n=1 Tax=Candidatus Uabimicrobium helgolandensis TaxID=3095367 RepID=UPI0035585262